MYLNRRKIESVICYYKTIHTFFCEYTVIKVADSIEGQPVLIQRTYQLPSMS